METCTRGRHLGLPLFLVTLLLTLQTTYSQTCSYGYHMEESVCTADVRLVDAPRPHYGRLQFWHNGAWGEVCGQPSAAITEVVCRHLGFLHAVGNLHQYRNYTSVFVAKSTTLYSEPGIVLQDVICTGEESYINDCDITVYSPQRPSSAGCESGLTFVDMECNVVRVRNISTPSHQIVEVFNYGWNSTCGDVNVWRQTETDLLGHWLGLNCQLGHSVRVNDGSFQYTAPSVFHCSASSTNLFDCYQEATSCSTATYAAVVCSSEAQLTEFGTVSLLYRTEPYEVSVCYNTVQAYRSGSTQIATGIAHTACRHAGYPSGRAMGFDELVSPRLAGFYEIQSCGSPYSSLYNCVVNTADCPGPVVKELYNRTSYTLRVQCNSRIQDFFQDLDSKVYAGYVLLWYGDWFYPNAQLWNAMETYAVCKERGQPVIRGSRIVSAVDDPRASLITSQFEEYPFDVTCDSHTSYHDCPVDYSVIHNDGMAVVQVFCDSARLVEIAGYEGARVETYPNETFAWIPLCADEFDHIGYIHFCNILGYISQVEHPRSSFDYSMYCENINKYGGNCSNSCPNNETLHISCRDCECDLYEDKRQCLPCPSGFHTVQVGATSLNQCFDMTRSQRDCFFNTFMECLNNTSVYALAQIMSFEELSCLQAYIHDGCSFDNCGVSDHDAIVQDLKTGWVEVNCDSARPETFTVPGMEVNKCRIQDDFQAFSACLDMRGENSLAQLFGDCRNIHTAAASDDQDAICGVLNDVTNCYLNATFTVCSAEATRQAAMYLYSNGTIGDSTCTRTELNACYLGTDNCDDDATCIWSADSYSCSCNVGYTGDGVNCTDVDECSPEGDCHQEATCTNTDGSYQCSCNSGFSGDGFFCTEGCLRGEQRFGEADCVKCPRGSYKPDTGQQACTSCGPSMTTQTMGAILMNECIVECGAGFYTAFISNRPQGYCASCPLNTYTDRRGQLNCTQCPAFHSTTKEGSRSEDDCKECPLGFAGTTCQVKVPVITLVSPLYGPIAGGTLILIGGLHLSSTDGLIVQLDNITCPLVNSSDTQIMCLSASVNSSLIEQELRVCITWVNTQTTLCYHNGFFTYLPDPTVSRIFPTESFFMGGTNVTVTGTNLASVAHPALVITITYMEYNGSFTSGCEHVSNNLIICDTPTITVPDDVRQAIINQTDSRRQRRSTSSEAQITASIYLDAVRHRHAQGVPYTLIADPEVTRLTETLVFQSFWPFNDKKFDIKGSGFTTDAALNGTLQVVIGSGQCLKVERFVNLIVCTMSNKRPPKGDRDRGGELLIQVWIGRRLKFLVGYMDFQANILDYPPGRTGLIVGSVLLVLLIVVIVLFVRFRPFCKHRLERDHQYRRHSDASSHDTPPPSFGYGSSLINRPRYSPDSLSSLDNERRRPAERLLRGRF